MSTCVQLHHDPTLSTLLPGGVSVQIPRTSVGREYSEVVARDGSFYNCPALSNGEHSTHMRAPAQPKTPQSLLESCTHAVYVVVGPCLFAHLALHAAGQPVQQRLQPHRMLQSAQYVPSCPHCQPAQKVICSPGMRPGAHTSGLCSLGLPCCVQLSTLLGCADSLLCLGSIPPS